MRESWAIRAGIFSERRVVLVREKDFLHLEILREMRSCRKVSTEKKKLIVHMCQTVCGHYGFAQMASQTAKKICFRESLWPTAMLRNMGLVHEYTTFCFPADRVKTEIWVFVIKSGKDYWDYLCPGPCNLLFLPVFFTQEPRTKINARQLRAYASLSAFMMALYRCDLQKKIVAARSKREVVRILKEFTERAKEKIGTSNQESFLAGSEYGTIG